MKVNMMKVIGRLMINIETGTEQITEAKDADAIKQHTKYWLGSVETILQMANVIDDDEVAEEIIDIGLELKYNVYKKALIAAMAIREYDLITKFAKLRDEVTEELAFHPNN